MILYVTLLYSSVTISFYIILIIFKTELKPALPMASASARLLAWHSPPHRGQVLGDGHPESNMARQNSLQMEDLLGKIIYTWDKLCMGVFPAKACKVGMIEHWT